MCRSSQTHERILASFILKSLRLGKKKPISWNLTTVFLFGFQEPIKSRAPQLHLEYRFYKQLGSAGKSLYFFPLFSTLLSWYLNFKFVWFASFPRPFISLVLDRWSMWPTKRCLFSGPGGAVTRGLLVLWPCHRSTFSVFTCLKHACYKDLKFVPLYTRGKRIGHLHVVL